jgi:GNAT superfamily N-acetyltransferase
MSMDCLIRESRSGDEIGIRGCIVALQEFERTMEPRLRPGESMADEYFAQIRRRCDEADGQVFVALAGGAVVGFVAVLAREAFTGLEDPPGTYGLVTDLVVLESHRNKRIGRELLERAEVFARAAGAQELRVGVLAKNAAARHLYLSAGFAPHQEIFTKAI